MIAALRFAPALAALIATPAFAHSGHGAAAGAAAGFLHPLTGLDHALAMVAVGLIAARIGGRAIVLVPLSFLAMMSLGGALGAAGIALPFVELGIALSVAALGAALAARLSILAAMAIAGAFAILHGHAHGAEMPEAASGLAYGLGFIAATALLHAAGLCLGLAIARLGDARGWPLLRLTGGALAAAGLGLAAAAL